MWADVPGRCSCQARWASHQEQACEGDLPALRDSSRVLSRHDQDVFPEPRIPETFHPAGERDEPPIVKMREAGLMDVRLPTTFKRYQGSTPMPSMYLDLNTSNFPARSNPSKASFQ